MSIEMESKIDPTASYSDVKPARLLASVGILPHFFMATALRGKLGTEDVLAGMGKEYGFGTPFKFEGTVDSEGVYQSIHDDPPLHPLITMQASDTETGDTSTLHLYESAILSIVGSDGLTRITRMD